MVTHEPDVAACAGRAIHVRDGLIERDIQQSSSSLITDH
jgi:ABC-type lipoprotein export system ATPase subunit